MQLQVRCSRDNISLLQRMGKKKRCLSLKTTCLVPRSRIKQLIARLSVGKINGMVTCSCCEGRCPARSAPHRGLGLCSRSLEDMQISLKSVLCHVMLMGRACYIKYPSPVRFVFTEAVRVRNNADKPTNFTRI